MLHSIRINKVCTVLKLISKLHIQFYSVEQNLVIHVQLSHKNMYRLHDSNWHISASDSSLNKEK